MPVSLNKIPEKLPLPEPPGKLKWLALVIFIALLISGFLLSFWPKSMPADSVWFWFVITVIPVLFGGLCYAFRLKNYENTRDRILWWNHQHQKKFDELVALGQRAAVILGMAYMTPGPCNKLAGFLLDGNCLLQSFFSQQSHAAVTCACFENNADDVTSKVYQQRLENHLKSVISILKPELDTISGMLNVRFKHDGTLEEADILSVWHRIFPQNHSINNIDITTDNDGLMWLDTFLDKDKEELMLSVEINLFLYEREGQAESVSALLIASPEWQKNNPAEYIAKVHRPVVSEDMQAAVKDAALWGQVLPAEPFTLWRAQLKDNELGDFTQQMAQSGYLPGLKKECSLDTFFGRPATAVGNIALICASEHARESGEMQWLIIQDITSHQAIVRTA